MVNTDLPHLKMHCAPYITALAWYSGSDIFFSNNCIFLLMMDRSTDCLLYITGWFIALEPILRCNHYQSGKLKHRLKHGPECHMPDIGIVMTEARGPKARGLLS